jgi:hypothetical protein
MDYKKIFCDTLEKTTAIALATSAYINSIPHARSNNAVVRKSESSINEL